MTTEQKLERLAALSEAETITADDMEWLEEVIRDPASDVRAEAAMVLADHEEEGELVAALGPLLRDPEAIVREAACRGLAAVMERAAEEEVLWDEYDAEAPDNESNLPVELARDARTQLVAALADPEVSVQGAALWALGFLSVDDEVDEHIKRFAADKESIERRVAALDAMVATDRLYDWDDFIVAALDDPESAVRVIAAVSAGELEVQPAKDKLRTMAREVTEDDLRIAVLFGLIATAAADGDDPDELADELVEEGVPSAAVEEALDMLAARQALGEEYGEYDEEEEEEEEDEGEAPANDEDAPK